MDALYWIWLQQLFGIGTSRSQQMMESYDTPKKLYEDIVSGDLPKGFLVEKELEAVEKAMELAKKIESATLKKGCQIITPRHEDYPPLLKHIYAKPAALYVKGSLSALKDNITITVVGARKISNYGRQATEYLVKGLVKNDVVIISGLANGIDSCAHMAALENGGITVGVLACGLDIDYPKESGKMKTEICEQGAVMSEYPLTTLPVPPRFAPRNRVMSGMSNGVLVVEASEKSGSLITAKHALEYGREVFVVPSGIFDNDFAGSNKLIMSGSAKLVDSTQSILEEYPKYINNKALNAEEIVTKNSDRKPLPSDSDEFMTQIYAIIDKERKSANEIVQETKLAITDILPALTMLEILGVIQSYPGGLFGITE